MSKELVVSESQMFDLVQRKARALAASSLAPDLYRGNTPTAIGNCIIALDMARRMDQHPMLIMQNMHVISGKPVWGAPFLIASVNTCGRFTALRYEFNGKDGDDYGCRAVATELATGVVLEGAWITLTMARAEGWLTRKGSKWLTMPDQMFRYRAASFWVRAYAPEISLGMMTADEAEDIAPPPSGGPGRYLETVREDGRRCYAEGLGIEANLHDKRMQADLHTAWHSGYLEAQGRETDRDIGFTGEIEDEDGTNT